MPLTQADKDRLEEILRKLDSEKQGAILASVQSFMDWIERTAKDIWGKIRGTIEEVTALFDEMVNFFVDEVIDFIDDPVDWTLDKLFS